jgi:hypothetical protein
MMAVALGNAGHVPRVLAAGDAMDGAALTEDAAFPRDEQRQEQLEQRGLAATVGAEQRDALPSVKSQRHTVEHVARAVAVAKLSHIEDRGHAQPFRVSFST